MKSKERPYVLFVAEAIYNEVSKIKKKNSNFSNIDAIENFIGTKTFNEISSGEFHNKWLNKLKKNNSQTTSLLAHPGLARTNLQPKSIRANKSWQEEFAYKLMDPMFQSAEMGALPQITAATLPSAQGGEQYGPRFNFRGLPKICRNAPQALKEKSRKKLWDISEVFIKDI